MLTWDSFRKENKGKGWSPAKMSEEYQKAKAAENKSKVATVKKSKLSKSAIIATSNHPSLHEEVEHCKEVMQRDRRLKAMMTRL